MPNAPFPAGAHSSKRSLLHGYKSGTPAHLYNFTVALNNTWGKVFWEHRTAPQPNILAMKDLSLAKCILHSSLLFIEPVEGAKADSSAKRNGLESFQVAHSSAPRMSLCATQRRNFLF